MPTKKTAPKKTAARKEPKPSPKARKPSQLDRIEQRLGLIESSLAVIRSGATFMQELDKAKPQPEGLQPGDYTDASKETADALTAMGFKWWDNDLEPRAFVMLSKLNNMAYVDACEGKVVHLTPAEFISRAAVTAKALGLVPVEPWVPKVGEWVVVTDKWQKAYCGDSPIRKVIFPPGNPAHVWIEGHGGNYHAGLSCGDYDYYSKMLRPATDAEIAAHLAEQEARANAEKVAKMKAMKPGTPINVKGKNQCTFIALDECLVWYAHKEDGSYYAALCGASDVTVIEQP